MATILFTGYKKPLRLHLEEQARHANLKVVKSVTRRLDYLCLGPNAGRSKLRKAMEQKTRLIYEEDFQRFLVNL